MARHVYPSLVPPDQLADGEHVRWEGIWTEALCQSLEQQLFQNQLRWSAIPALDRAVSILPDVQDLYKYRTFDYAYSDRIKAIFTDQKLWSASLSSLNDPMEGGFKDVGDSNNKHDIFSGVYLMKTQWSGCVSFSLDPVSTLMWSHYAKDHTGFCIKYRRRDSNILVSGLCQPVMYRNSMPRVSYNVSTPTKEAIDVVFWTKSESWEYEREWRLRYPRIDSYTYPGLLIPYGVIFGLKMPTEARELIRKMAPTLQYGSVMFSEQDFRLKIIWEQEQKELLNDALNKEAPRLSELFETTLNLAIDIASMYLDEIGGFNPFGVVVYRGQADVLMIDRDLVSSEGILGNQMAREIEDRIGAVRQREKLEFAALILDANVRSIEDGTIQSAIEGRLEENGGPAVQFFQYYELIDGKSKLGKRTIIARDHNLISDQNR